MMKKSTIAEMGRFVLVGAAATLLHYAIYYGLMALMWPTVAYALGYILSFAFNYVATTFFTFRTRPAWKNLLGMMGAHGVNFLLHMGLFQAFLWSGIPEAWIPLPVYAIAVPLNFLLVRFVFTDSKKKK